MPVETNQRPWEGIPEGVLQACTESEICAPGLRFLSLASQHWGAKNEIFESWL